MKLFDSCFTLWRGELFLSVLPEGLCSTEYLCTESVYVCNKAGVYDSNADSGFTSPVFHTPDPHMCQVHWLVTGDTTGTDHGTIRQLSPINLEHPDMSLHIGVLCQTSCTAFLVISYFTSIMRPVFTCRCSAPVAISRYR